MHNRIRKGWVLGGIALWLLCGGIALLLLGPLAIGQTRPAAPAKAAAPVPAAAPAGPAPTERDVASTQEQLIKLLRLSPTLTTVVARDPSLLSNQEYVARNNPQLADFLAAHPEVARNPDYYLFTHLNRDGGGPDEALERAVWPDLISRPARAHGTLDELLSDMAPTLLEWDSSSSSWLGSLRLIIENRRWSRILRSKAKCTAG